MSDPGTLQAPWLARPGVLRTRTAWAVAAIAVAGWFLRALPLMRSGAFGYPVDYDEGVYFATSALLVKGVLPYRDFVFVHPPGLLYFFAPVASLGVLRDPSFGFAAARWLATLVGCANIVLVGRLAMRWAGPVAAILAAAFYATHPVAVPIERGPFLEPVLNLCGLWLASVWLAAEEAHPIRWRSVACGALCGLTASIKILGALWLLPCLLSPPRAMSRGGAVALAASAALVWTAVTAPLFLAAPASFIAQLVSFHAHRPPDGTFGGVNRLAEMFWMQGLSLDSSLIFCGLLFAAVRARGASRRAERFFASGFVLIVAAFLASSTYWSQYNAHLALPESMLAGYGAASLWQWASQGRARFFRRALVSALLAAVPAWGVRRALLTGRQRSPELPALGHFVQAQIPVDACLLSFEPAWSAAGGRLPDNGPQLPRVVDSYATILLDALRASRGFADTGQAFRDPSSQGTIRRALEQCRFAIVGGRGYSEMSPETQQWFRSRFVQRFPPAGVEGIDVWERAH